MYLCLCAHVCFCICMNGQGIYFLEGDPRRVPESNFSKHSAIFLYLNRNLLKMTQMGNTLKIWEYSTIIGISMCLVQNFILDIVYAVHQCARFIRCQHNSRVIKINWRYLIGTTHKWLILNHIVKFQMDCYVNAGFSGPWSWTI